MQRPKSVPSIFICIGVVIILCIFVFGIVCSAGLWPVKKNWSLMEMNQLQAGVTSEPLYLGKEQLSYFDDYGGVRMYLAEYSKDEFGNGHIVGNIDFVKIDTQKENGVKQEHYHVVIRNQIAMTYRYQNGKRYVTELQAQSLPGSEYAKLDMMESRALCEKDQLLYDKPVASLLSVRFSDYLYGIGNKFTWEYAITLDDQERVILSLQPVAEDGK